MYKKQNVISFIVYSLAVKQTWGDSDYGVGIKERFRLRFWSLNRSRRYLVRRRITFRLSESEGGREGGREGGEG